MKYFLDTEFDGFGGALISVGLVREDQYSLSFVVQDWADDPWVRENVIPILWTANASTKHCTPEEGADQIAHFLKGDPDPVIITDWPSDIRYFCQLIEFPGGNMAPIAGLKFELRRVDAYPTTLAGAVQHNAWWDAMALRHLLSGGDHKSSALRPAVKGPGTNPRTITGRTT